MMQLRQEQAPGQELPSSSDAVWMCQRPLLRLHDGSIEGYVAPHSLQISVRQLKAFFASLRVCGPMIPHHLVVLISCGCLEHVILRHRQGTDLHTKECRKDDTVVRGDCYCDNCTQSRSWTVSEERYMATGKWRGLWYGMFCHATSADRDRQEML